MSEGKPYLELRICLQEPAELLLLVGALAAIGHQFDDYLKREHPNLHGHAQLFVQEIRQGSIIVELIPVIQPLIQNMDQVLIVDGFIRRFRDLLGRMISGDDIKSASRSDLRDFMDTVKLIATDPNGSASIASARYTETAKTKKAEVTFSGPEAQKALLNIQRRRVEIDLPAYEVRENVFMRFYQSNIGDAPVGQRKTNEKVIIEAIHPKPLPLVYETDLAAERIKHETRDDAKNLYRKGFFVDCYIEKSASGKLWAYRITNVRAVIDIDPDE